MEAIVLVVMTCVTSLHAARGGTCLSLFTESESNHPANTSFQLSVQCFNATYFLVQNTTCCPTCAVGNAAESSIDYYSDVLGNIEYTFPYLVGSWSPLLTPLDNLSWACSNWPSLVAESLVEFFNYCRWSRIAVISDLHDSFHWSVAELLSLFSAEFFGCKP